MLWVLVRAVMANPRTLPGRLTYATDRYRFGERLFCGLPVGVCWVSTQGDGTLTGIVHSPTGECLGFRLLSVSMKR